MCRVSGLELASMAMCKPLMAQLTGKEESKAPRQMPSEAERLDKMRAQGREAFYERAEMLTLQDIGFNPRASSRYSHLKARREVHDRASRTSPDPAAATQRVGETCMQDDVATTEASCPPLSAATARFQRKHVAEAAAPRKLPPLEAACQEKPVHPQQPCAPRPASTFDRRRHVVQNPDGRVKVLVA